MTRHPQEFDGPAQPCAPTDALPGTEEKIRILQERAARHENLFHEGDARWPATGLLAFIGLKDRSQDGLVRLAVVNEVTGRPRLVCRGRLKEKPLKRRGLCSRCYRRRDRPAA